MTKKITHIFLIGLLLLTFISCDEFLDVNTDPNVPVDVPENLMITGILARHAYQVVGNWPARHGVKWAQQISWAASVPPTWDNYDLLEGGTDASWGFAYANIIKNAVALIEKAEANGNYAYVGISKVIIAWNLSVLTDTYGDIPWSEALDPVLTTKPVYDSQQFIYQEVLRLLNEAVADFDRPSPLRPVAHDLVYGGNMDNWKSLAYSLIARYNMRLTYAPGENRAQRAQQALTAVNSGFTSNAQNAMFVFVDAAGARNPWWQFAISGQWDDRDRLSYNYTELLKSLNDPRLPIQARPTLVTLPDGTNYGGHPNGEWGGNRDTVSQIGEYYSAPNAPLYLFHYPELKFIQAEATLYAQSAAAADPIYREAIAAHMDKLGVDAGDRDTYIAALPNLGSLTPDQALEAIMIQKYIANFLSPEVWVDWRRTNYPRLTPVTVEARLDEIPRRFPYPLGEWTYNEANVIATGVPLGYSSMKSRVWWDPN
jgi:hypothetical protein